MTRRAFGNNRRFRGGGKGLHPRRGELKLRPEANTYILLSAPQVQPRVKFSSCLPRPNIPSRSPPRLSSSMHLGRRVVSASPTPPRPQIFPRCSKARQGLAARSDNQMSRIPIRARQSGETASRVQQFDSAKDVRTCTLIDAIKG